MLGELVDDRQQNEQAFERQQTQRVSLVDDGRTTWLKSI